MSLTDLKIRKLSAQDKKYKTTDRDGLYLEVLPSGRKSFRYNYTFESRQKTITYGNYPLISLAEAREAHTKAQALLKRGKCPATDKQQSKGQHSNTFRDFANAWLDKRQKDQLAPATIKKDKMLVKLLIKDLGNIPIEEMKPQQLIQCLKKQSDKGHKSWPSDMRSRASQIFRFAIASGMNCSNLANDVVDALPRPPAQKNHPAIISPKDVGKLLLDCSNYTGTTIVSIGLLLLAHTFVRPGSLRQARWGEFNFNEALWTIPAENMKGKVGLKKEHLVPLSSQALKLLDQLKPHTFHRTFLFQGQSSKDQPISENTFNKALKNMGYDTHTHRAHGFRTTASTNLNELGFDVRWIEKQLAHEIENKVTASYNKAEYLEDRKAMMQSWSDYLVKLMQQAK